MPGAANQRTPIAPQHSLATSGCAQMSELLLGPMLRFVDESAATIWMETDEPGRVQILDSTTHTFTVEGRHYALAVIENLQPGSETEYDVVLNGSAVWPDVASGHPASVIRTPASDSGVSVLVGSCRAAAPHEPPYTLELALDADGRGVDTLWAHGKRMLSEQQSSWPDLLVLVGDQIYADDSSPKAKARIEERRLSNADLDSKIVKSFDEYCWLYHEAWSEPVERWLFSNIPSAMIFDDHDNIDDWNISASWLSDISEEPWWEEHAISALTTYWIYQHLGNLSPSRIRDEGLLDELLSLDDGSDRLRAWAQEVLATTPTPGGYQFSYHRVVGDLTLVVIDCRNGRVLSDGTRLMVGPDEWNWVREIAELTTGHLMLATSVPVFIADGLHDLQVWNERVAGGAWGKTAARMAESIRRGLDLEDWSAFATSYQQFVDLLVTLQTSEAPPKSIIVASGDIHFSYAASVPLSEGDSGPTVWQVVSSPIRNALIPPERGVMRMTLTRAGRVAGGLLRRMSGARESRPGIKMAAGPFFANNMAEISYRGGEAFLQIEQSSPDEEGNPQLEIVADLRLGHSSDRSATSRTSEGRR